MIHEWEENRAKGKREEERVWESGDEAMNSYRRRGKRYERERGIKK